MGTDAEWLRRCRSVKSGVWIGCALFCTVAVLRAETLTIATYNVENYVAADRVTEEGFRRNYPKPEVQKRALRQVIAALAADVFVLQEMGAEPYLEELRRDLRQSGVEYPHAVLLVAADSERHLAVLSKRPLARTVRHERLSFTHRGATELVKRGLLEIDVETRSGTVTVFCAHLKSRYTEHPDDPRSSLRRTGEATAIRDLVLRRFPDPAAAWFVLAGDFNDDRASRPMRRLLRRGRTTIAHLLPAADSRGESWTHAYRRQDSYTRVDHILVSPALRPRVVGGAARIHDGEGVREASDHRPVVVTFEFSEP